MILFVVAVSIVVVAQQPMLFYTYFCLFCSCTQFC